MTAVEDAYRLLENGNSGRALAELERAGDAGDPTSLLELAVWRLEGRHVPRDLPLAREYFRKAGQLGNLDAENADLSFLANGIGGAADWRTATARLLELARTNKRAERQIELLEAMALDANGYPTEKPTGKHLSESPDAWAFEAFASEAECRYLIETAAPLLEQSVIVDPATGQLRPHPIRTSDGAAFPWISEDLVISALNRRIAAASGTELGAGEPLQVLRYRPGQEYRPHLDALPTGDNQRVLTMLVYLNDGYPGGETYFTRAQLKFSGRLGAALLFRNADSAGVPDKRAEHAGLPVLSGEKYIASRWIRERPIVDG